MAQALTIECIKNGERFAALWFRWGAYTSVVYHIGKDLIDGLKKRGYNDNMSIDDIRKLLLDILEKDFVFPEVHHVDVNGKEYVCGGVHGGMDCRKDDDGNLTELPYWKSIGVEPVLEKVSSSEGLIAVTEEAMESCYGYSCACEVLDFDNHSFSNHNFYRYCPDDAKDWFDLSDKEIEDIPEVDTSGLEDFGWDEIDEVINEYNNHVRPFNSVHGFIAKEPVSGELIEVDE